MKCKVISFLMFFGLFTAQAQEIPANYHFGVPQDYRDAEPLISECIDFLLSTAVGSDPVKRVEVGNYLNNWASGVPYVTITIYPFVSLSTQSNPDLYDVYIAGFIKSYFEDPERSTDDNYYFGILAVLEVYKMGGAVRAQEDLDDLVELQEKGKLKKHIYKTLSW